MQKYYDILGLQPNASQDEIKKAYRKLAKEHHPDIGGDEEKFKKITEAYEILSGKRKQSRQDQWEFTESDDILKDFINKVNQGFGAAQSFRRAYNKPPEEDRDVVFGINTSVEEIKHGKEFEIQYTKSTLCKKCEGIGGESKKSCQTCNGHGTINNVHKQGNMIINSMTTCYTCHGNGTMIENVCVECSGLGFKTKVENLKFEIKEKK